VSLSIYPEDSAKSCIATTYVQYAWPENIVQEILQAYPADPNDGIPSSQTLGGDVVLGPPFGAMYRRSAAYIGDMAFIAGRRLTCSTWAAANVPAYCYRFNAIPATSSWPFGVTHFTEVAFVFNNVDGLGYAINPFANRSESYTDLSDLMSKSWASFVYDLDPNGWVGRDAGVPSWPAYIVESPMNMVWEANITSHTEVSSQFLITLYPTLLALQANYSPTILGSNYLPDIVSTLNLSFKDNTNPRFWGSQPDTFRADGMRILNANWKLILR
jgi:hypothetical protein